MDRAEFELKQKNIVQGVLMDKEKWYLGEKIKKDLGQEAYIQWIGQYAVPFAQGWKNSKCKHCENWYQCGYIVKQVHENCDPYRPFMFFRSHVFRDR